jgi:chromosome segregation ATPase
MSEEIRIKKVEEQIGHLQSKLNEVSHHFSRIEDKVNYIVALLETLWEATDESEEDEETEEYEDYSNEGWIPGLDDWKEEDDE